ncbi:TolC family outer membrane protein [Erwinia sp. HR93]|uniref:TolC family outer membrane protein n=1 Tax=Erwinia sp. HR93 TaxID=3094840 RepID=UPI002ADEA6E4|nr:TolC family outer membrane protein [Erwinia sp. HR93]MEA1062453.1 TolC family outer membrane protein [Erwinia sp. HR93]
MRYHHLGLALLMLPGFAKADTLLDAVKHAGATNAEMQAAIYQQLSSSEKEWQGIAGFLPSLQLTGSYTEQDQPKAAYAAKVTRHDWGLSLTQPLFDVSKYADYLRGKAMSQSGEIQLLKTQQKIINDVSDAYARVLYLRDVLHSAQVASKTYEKQLAQARAAMDMGDVTRIDVDEAQANLDVSRAKEIEAENELSAAGARYTRLTGLSYRQVEPIAAQCLVARKSFQRNSEKLLLNRALAQNVDVRLAETQMDIAHSDVVAATSGHLPVARLQASYGTNWSRGEGENPLDSLFGTTSKTTNSYIGVQVTVPIFNGGLALSQSREAAYKKEEARYQLIDTRHKIEEDLHTALLNINNSVALVTSTQRVITSEKSKVDSTSLGKDMGLRTQIDELNAQQRYYEAIKNNAEARFKLLSAKINLSRIMGDLGYNVLSDITCTN